MDHFKTGRCSSQHGRYSGRFEATEQTASQGIVERQALGGSNSSLVLGTSLRNAASPTGAFCTAYPQIVPRTNSPGYYIGSVIS